MQFQQGLNPNCSEYTMIITVPTETTRAYKLSCMLDSFHLDKADREDLTDGIAGIYSTSIRSFKLQGGVVVVKGYLNKDGLVEWLTKNGYEFQVEGD